MRADRVSTTGIYVAHDSMGVARYIGRGNIFDRLKARRKAQVLELVFFPSTWVWTRLTNAKSKRS